MKLLLNTKRGLVTHDATPLVWSSKRGYGVASILDGAMNAYYIADASRPFEAGIVVRKPTRKGTRFAATNSQIN